MTTTAIPPQGITLIPAEAVLEELRALRADIAALAPAAAAAGTPEYLPFAKLAAHFGFSRATAHRYIASAVSDGALRTIRPKDAHNRRGDTLYHLADFTTYISRQ